VEDERTRWLAGCWDLAECIFTAIDGSTHSPWGEVPIGMLLFTPSGEFAAHGGRRGRAPFAGENPTPDEKRQAYDDYFSYYGRVVSFDDKAGTMVSVVEGATNPGWIGGQQLRCLDVIDDATIVLRTLPLPLAGRRVVGRMTWRRRGAGDASAG